MRVGRRVKAGRHQEAMMMIDNGAQNQGATGTTMVLFCGSIVSPWSNLPESKVSVQDNTADSENRLLSVKYSALHYCAVQSVEGFCFHTTALKLDCEFHL